MMFWFSNGHNSLNYNSPTRIMQKYKGSVQKSFYTRMSQGVEKEHQPTINPLPVSFQMDLNISKIPSLPYFVVYKNLNLFSGLG